MQISGIGRQALRATSFYVDCFGQFQAPILHPHAQNDMHSCVLGNKDGFTWPETDGVFAPVRAVANANRISNAAFLFQSVVIEHRLPCCMHVTYTALGFSETSQSA
jgi:hypothetical protein